MDAVTTETIDKDLSHDSGTPIVDPPPKDPPAPEPEQLSDEQREELISEIEAEEVPDLSPINLPATPTDASEGMQLVYKVLRRRQRILLEAQRVADQVKAMLAESAAKVKAIDYVYGAIIQGTVRDELAKSKKKNPPKSIKTPFATLGFRKAGGNLVIVDEGKVIETLDKAKDAALRGCLIRKPQIDKRALNLYHEQTGDLVAGTELEPVRDDFYIR